MSASVPRRLPTCGRLWPGEHEEALTSTFKSKLNEEEDENTHDSDLRLSEELLSTKDLIVMIHRPDLQSTGVTDRKINFG